MTAALRLHLYPFIQAPDHLPRCLNRIPGDDYRLQLTCQYEDVHKSHVCTVRDHTYNCDSSEELKLWIA